MTVLSFSAKPMSASVESGQTIAGQNPPFSDDVVLLTSGEEGVVYRLTYKWRSVNGSALRCIIKEIDGLPIQGTEIVGKRRCVLWRV